jgi:hypothetical protein
MIDIEAVTADRICYVKNAEFQESADRGYKRGLLYAAEV